VDADRHEKHVLIAEALRQVADQIRHQGQRLNESGHQEVWLYSVGDRLVDAGEALGEVAEACTTIADLEDIAGFAELVWRFLEEYRTAVINEAKARIAVGLKAKRWLEVQ